jgi:tetratricopeptide (TPR) repeat protein
MKNYFSHIFLISALLIISSSCFSQNAKIDSLKKVLLAAKEDSIKVNVLNELTKKFIHRSDYEIALQYANDALTLSGQSLLLNTSGKQYGAFLKGKSQALVNFGVIYFHLGDYPRALDYDFRALKLLEEGGDKIWQAVVLGNIANVYTSQGDFSGSLDYHLKALKIAEAAGKKSLQAANLGNIGNLYFDQGKYNEALDYYSRALKITEEIPNRYLQGFNISNIGLVYAQQGNHQAALKNYFKALEIYEVLKNKDAIGFTYIDIAKSNILLAQLSEARDFLNKAMELSGEIGSKENIKNAYKIFAQLDSAEGNHKHSLEHYRMYIVYRDSLINEENTKKTVQTQMQYEFDKKEADTKSEQDKKDAVTKIVIYSISGGLFLVLVLAGFIFRSYRLKQKANIIITLQKQEVEKQKQLVEEKQKEIIDSIHYAKRIQSSLLPTEKYIERNLKSIIKN